jgi:hypothetical protein
MRQLSTKVQKSCTSQTLDLWTTHSLSSIGDMVLGLHQEQKIDAATLLGYLKSHINQLYLGIEKVLILSMERVSNSRYFLRYGQNEDKSEPIIDQPSFHSVVLKCFSVHHIHTSQTKKDSENNCQIGYIPIFELKIPSPSNSPQQWTGTARTLYSCF